MDVQEGIIYIADIGANHNGDFNRVRELIKVAKNIGCGAVKFQFFNAEKLYFSAYQKTIEKIKKGQMPRDFIPRIKSECIKQDILFACSVFHIEDVEYLNNYVDIFKIGSYELLHLDLIKSVAQTGKRWILSTGMGSNNEIKLVLDEVVSNDDRFFAPDCILYCISNYPVLPRMEEDWHLYRPYYPQYLSFENFYHIKNIGWSDHTASYLFLQKIIEFLNFYCSVIEFHLDLEDKAGFETFLGQHCWVPSQIQKVIDYSFYKIRHSEPFGKNCNLELLERIKKSTFFRRDNINYQWRTEPKDGQRPLKKYRKKLLVLDI